ncbi:MAG: type IV secretion system DNA-binding domain-containing protein [Patescibacteria group bacterium]
MMFFAALQVSTLIHTQELPASVGISFFDAIILGSLLLFVAVVFVVLLFLLRNSFRSKKNFHSAVTMKILHVLVPKESKKGNDEQGTEKIQEMISVMETIFSTLGSLRAQKGFMAWLKGRSDHFSFEMVYERSKIHFYIAAPSDQRNFIEEQIHAQFSDAMIEEVPDYNIFSPTGVIIGSYLNLRKNTVFPIKTYTKLESDPLNSITNALAKLHDDEGAAIQIVVRSAQSSWRKEGLRIAREMQQGKKLHDVMNGKNKAAGMASNLGKEIVGVAFGSKKTEKEQEQYRLSPREEEMVKGLEEKAAKAGLDANIRVIVCTKTPSRSQQALNDILQSFGQYSIFEYGNAFVKAMPKFRSRIIDDFIYRTLDEKYAIVLNAEELASVYHFPLPTTETPKIEWLLARSALPPSNLPSTGILLGVTEYRGHRYDIRMKDEDRRRHLYIIGGSGAGKSAFQSSLIRQDILAGKGVCVIDPHGDLAEEALTFVPRERADDVIYFNPSDVDRPMALNMLEFDPAYPEQKTFVINEMLKIFDKLYDLKSTGGPMFEQYMRNAMMLIMDHPESGSTLMEIPKVLSDEEFRAFKIKHCRSQVVRDFWVKEAQKAGGEASLANMVPYITSKLTPFIANDIMRPIIGQQKSAFNVRQAMDDGKILLLNLSKGKLGDINAYLIGMILVGKILMAALSRTDMDPSKRKDFYLYIDEFQNFLTDSISAILSEARKYGLDLIVAHQYIGQLVKNNDTQIRDAIFGNVGTKCIFRVGTEDAEFLEKEFAPTFSMYDLQNVEGLNCLTRLLIDNTVSKPFKMKLQFAPRAGDEEKELASMIKELSRYKYGRKRELVEAEIRERSMAVEAGY